MTNFGAACDHAVLKREIQAHHIHLTLSERWRRDAAAGVPPDQLVDAVNLRVGDRAITAHLDPVPVVPTLTGLVHALADVLDGGRQSASSMMSCERIEFASDGGLRLSVGMGARATLVSAPVDGDALLDALPAHTAVDELADALDRLASLQRPRLPSTAGPDDVPPAVAPSGRGPLAFGFRPSLSAREVVRLEVRLGAAFVPGGRASLTSFADALVSAVEATLQTRGWPPGMQIHALDPTADRRLSLWRTDDGLSASVIDSGDHDLCEPVTVSSAALAAAVQRFVDRSRAHARPAEAGTLASLARNARELATWSRALASADRLGPAEPPAGWTAYATEARPSEDDPLPVRGLHFLAYRRGWRREAPGLEAIDATADQLLVYDAGGLTALRRHDGTAAWHVPDLHPLDAAPPGFAAHRSGALVRFDPQAGAQLWRAPMRGAATPRRVHACGSIVLAESADRALRGLDADTGRSVWRQRTLYGVVTGVTTHGPVAWMTAEDGFVSALHIADGSERFRIAMADDPEGPPQLTEAGLLLTQHRAPTDESTLVMLDPLTGAVRWRRALDGATTRAAHVSRGAALLVIDDGAFAQVVCIALSDGALRWSHAIESATEPTILRAVGEQVFAKSADGSVNALSFEDGAAQWTVEGDDPDLSLLTNAPPVVARGVLLVPGTRVRVIDPETGRVVQALDCGELVPGWLHAWRDGDLAIAEDDAVAHYLLGGHLALVG